MQEKSYIFIHMSGRRKIADLEVRRAVSSGLRNYFQSGEARKAEFARQWKINPQMLYRYLNGSATPSTEVLARLVRVPGLSLPFAGKSLRPEDVPLRGTVGKSAGVQLKLGFEEPLKAILGDQRVSVTAVRQPSGSVEIKLEVSSAA
jgi:hypothetical protein